jgi:hypothetical protein
MGKVMNTAPQNRIRVAIGTATATSGMRKQGLGTKNRPVYSNDRSVTVWPCQKDHPHYRIHTVKDNAKTRLVCLECELERLRERRKNA